MKSLESEIERIKSIIDSGYIPSELSEDEEAETEGPDAPSSSSVPVWTSGRGFGPTYQNDPKYIWVSGINRGKANSLF